MSQEGTNSAYTHTLQAHMDTRRQWLMRAAAAALSCAIPPMGQAAPTEKTTKTAFSAHSDKRRVTINLTLEPNSLDPTMAPAAAVAEATHYNILEGLTKIEEDGGVSALLAHTWTVDSSQRHYTFALRRDARFHDGSVFDANAVRFSFERARAPGSTNKARQALFDNIAHMDAPNAHTFTLALHNPDPHLLFRLGESTAVIVHPHSAQRTATQPIGTGPYRLEKWQPQHSITLTKADTWGATRMACPIERATLRFFYGAQAIEAARKTQEIDVFFHYAADSLDKLLLDEHYQLLIGSSSGKGLLAFNHRRAPLNDVRVRRAITHAIDREGFIHSVLHGRASAIGSHFSPSDPGYVHLTSLWPYDPSQARALLRATGLKLPLQLRLALPPPAYARLGGQFIAHALAAVGIEVQLQEMEWAQWLSGPFQGDFDITLINHVEPLDYPIYTNPHYYFGYDSADFRDLVQRHGAATSGRERQKIFAQIQRHLAHDAVNAWIFTPQMDTVVCKGLRGVRMHYPIFAHDISAMHWI